MLTSKFLEILSLYSYQDTKEVKILCCTGVIATLVLELGVPVEGV